MEDHYKKDVTITMPLLTEENTQTTTVPTPPTCFRTVITEILSWTLAFLVGIILFIVLKNLAPTIVDVVNDHFVFTDNPKLCSRATEAALFYPQVLSLVGVYSDETGNELIKYVAVSNEGQCEFIKTCYVDSINCISYNELAGKLNRYWTETDYQ